MQFNTWESVKKYQVLFLPLFVLIAAALFIFIHSGKRTELHSMAGEKNGGAVRPEKTEDSVNFLNDRAAKLKNPFAAACPAGGRQDIGRRAFDLPVPKGSGEKVSFIVRGIVEAGEKRAAIIEHGKNSEVVHEGQFVDGYEAKRITARQVVLQKGGQQTVLTVGQW